MENKHTFLYEKNKRLLFLEALGIPIPVPYNVIHSRIFEYLKFDESLFLKNMEGDDELCYFKNDVIIFSIKKEYIPFRKEDGGVLRLNIDFLEFLEDLEQEFEDINSEEIYHITDIILKKMEVKYVGYQKFNNREEIEKYFGFFDAEYKKIENLKK